MSKAQDIAEKFRRQFTILEKDLRAAQAHTHVAKGLHNSIAEFEGELNSARLFWGMTIQAHRVAALASICRVFDKHSSGTHLPLLLQEVKDNLPAFDKEQFFERYKNDPWRLTFGPDAQRPSIVQLEADIAFCSGDSVVVTLRNWRNNAIAHTNQRITTGTLQLEQSDPLTMDMIQHLVTKGYEIVNHYSTLFQGMDFGGFLLEHLDDYREMLKTLRRGYAANGG